MKQRIWELDAFRGFCVLAMVLVHLLFDFGTFFHQPQILQNGIYRLVSGYGGIFFVLISGIAVTFSRSSLRRGLLVLLCGLGVTAVTMGMYLLHLADESIVISFGVLHCLGVCMLLWPLFKRLPNWVLVALAAVICVAGYYFIGNVRVDTPWLFPLGLLTDHFFSADYFPIAPNLGFFLLGGVLGRTVYKDRKTRFPQVDENLLILRFFRFCGRHSLSIYLVHQPLLTGLMYLGMILKS